MGGTWLRLVLAGMLALAGLTGCTARGEEWPDAGYARTEEGKAAGQERDLTDERALPDEVRRDGEERDSENERVPGEARRRETDAGQPAAPESGAPETDPTVPEMLDELPDAGAALYMAFDETGNAPRLILEIGGERREVLRPESVRWAYLREADVDRDGTGEIVITYSLGGGTGVSAGRMAVFRRDFTEMPYEDPLIVLREKMSMSMDHAKREIVLEAEGRSWRIPFPDEGTDWWPEPYIGNTVGYSVQGDRPYAYAGLQASIGWFVADLYLGYIWDGKRLAATEPEVHVPWQTAVPFQYEDEELGLSVRVPAGWFVDTGAFGDWSAAGEGFTILVEGHPENVIRNDVNDWITVTGLQSDRNPAGKRRKDTAKEAWEQVDVTMESGEKAVLFFVRIGETVELTFWSEKAEARGVLRETTFKKHRDAIVDMLASLKALD